MSVLAIDPAVRNTGYAVLEGDPRKPTVLDYNVISIPQKFIQSSAVYYIFNAILLQVFNIALQ